MTDTKIPLDLGPIGNATLTPLAYNRVMVDAGIPLNVDTDTGVTLNGVECGASAKLFRGPERELDEGEGWTTIYAARSQRSPDYVEKYDTTHVTRIDAYSGPRVKEASDSMIGRFRRAVEAAVGEWSATPEGELALRRADAEYWKGRAEGQRKRVAEVKQTYEDERREARELQDRADEARVRLIEVGIEQGIPA